MKTKWYICSITNQIINNNYLCGSYTEDNAFSGITVSFRSWLLFTDRSKCNYHMRFFYRLKCLFNHFVNILCCVCLNNSLNVNFIAGTDYFSIIGKRRCAEWVFAIRYFQYIFELKLKYLRIIRAVNII